MSIYSTGMYLTEWWKSIIITCNILKSIAQPQFLFQIQIFISGYRGEPWYTILKVDLGFPLIVSVLVWFWPDTTLVYCVLALWGGETKKEWFKHREGQRFLSLSQRGATRDLLGLHLYQTIRYLLLPGHWSVPNTRLLTRTWQLLLSWHSSCIFWSKVTQNGRRTKARLEGKQQANDSETSSKKTLKPLQTGINIAIRVYGISSPTSFSHVLACYKPSDQSNTQE